MTTKQALAYARHELEFYKQVKKDGIAMTTSLEFWSIVVAALDKMLAQASTKTRYGFPICPKCNKVLEESSNYCNGCGQKLR